MNKNTMAQRAFFVGKVSKYLVSGALLVALVIPVATQAQTVASTTIVDNSIASNASSIIASTGIMGAENLPLPTIRASMVWVTAYASVPDETDGNPFITANGDHVHDGIIAANWLPFGTEVTIPALFGNKVFTVDDRMNQIFNQRADIWMPTVADAVHFGIKHVEIVVLNTPSSTATL
jgi:3D (Asp-Asp-Asp) domain-containing protein